MGASCGRPGKARPVRRCPVVSEGGDDDGRGADSEDFINAKESMNGFSALHLAAIGGTRVHFNIARVLIAAGAKHSVVDGSGDAPADCAAASTREASQAWQRLLVEGDVGVTLPDSRPSGVRGESGGGRNGHRPRRSGGSGRRR